MRLKQFMGAKKTSYKFKVEVEIWPIPWEATLDPSARVMKWGVLGKEREENKDIFPEKFSEALESIIHELWLSRGCGIQVVDEL